MPFGIPRITRIYADFSFSVRLSIFVGSAFVCVHAAQPGKVLMGPRQYHVKLVAFLFQIGAIRRLDDTEKVFAINIMSFYSKLVRLEAKHNSKPKIIKLRFYSKLVRLEGKEQMTQHPNGSFLFQIGAIRRWVLQS